MSAATLPAETRVLQALLRTDFRAFLEKVFNTLTPAQQYIRGSHIDAIAWRLERVRRGEIVSIRRVPRVADLRCSNGMEQSIGL